MKKIVRMSILIGIILISIIACKKDKPEIPSVLTSQVSAITQLSATCGGNVTLSGGADVTARGVCWGISPNPTLADNKTNNGVGTGNFTSEISGLSPNTFYYVRAYATNSVGTTYGKEVSFSTGALLLATLSTLEATSISYTTAFCGGIISSDGGAAVTEKGICYSTNHNPRVSDNKIVSLDETNNYTTDLSSLNHSNTYYVRAYAINSVGTTYGNEISFSTLVPVAPSITTESVNSIAISKAVISSNATSNSDPTITELGICYSTQANPTIADSKMPSRALIGHYLSNMTKLTANTTYHVRAYATNSLGTFYGNDLEFKTLASTVSDIDLNVYDIIEIGNQLWLKQNIKTTKFSNGDVIETTATMDQYIGSISEPRYQWPAMGNEANVVVYGRHYTWYAATDSRNICPSGWHVPTDAEWVELINFLGGEQSAGGKLKSVDYWLTPNSGGTDEVGFKAVPGGHRIYDGNWAAFGENATMWTSNEIDNEWAKSWVPINEGTRIYPANWVKKNGAAVRCVKD